LGQPVYAEAGAGGRGVAQVGAREVDRTEDGVTLRVDSALIGELGLGDSVAVNGVCLTATELDESGFDRALVDAPCSGLGVLARRPDLRWRARPLPELQLELLQAAAERTNSGGTIVYSVCTLNADENEAIVDASGLEVLPLTDEWPQYAHPTRPEFLLTMPHRDHTSGFFIARLRKP